MNMCLIFLLIFFNIDLLPGSNWSGMSEAMEVDKEATKQQQEPFPFTRLPLDIQKLIASYMWVAQDSNAEFRQRLLDWDYKLEFANQTSITERHHYGFNGQKTPIHFYTYIENKPSIVEVGCILHNAQPSIMGGYWYADSHVFSTHIFLEHKYHLAEKNYLNHNLDIKRPNFKIAFQCSALSVHGDLAIIWSDKSAYNKEYLTFLTLDQKDFQIDLAKNKIVLQDYFKNYESFKRGFTLCCLFNKQGTQLGIVRHCAWDPTRPDYAYNPEENYLFIDAPSKDKKLTPQQVMKRLMISKTIFNKNGNDNIPQ